VEEEANAYFQRIYNEGRPVSEVIERLRAFKQSASARDQDLFGCMVHNLFDEYRFFR
jgi:CCR4-NOT transcription complex subunit 1